MRLNDGLPVWHVSATLWTPGGKQVRSASRLERAAVTMLTGVGGDREWWLWSPAGVAHLRVALTGEEAAQLPAGCAVHDAGDAGRERRRTVTRSA